MDMKIKHPNPTVIGAEIILKLNDGTRKRFTNTSSAFLRPGDKLTYIITCEDIQATYPIPKEVDDD